MKNNVLVLPIAHAYFYRPGSRASVCNKHILPVSVAIIVHVVASARWVFFAEHTGNFILSYSVLIGTAEDSIIVKHNYPSYNKLYNTHRARSRGACILSLWLISFAREEAAHTIAHSLLTPCGQRVENV